MSDVGRQDAQNRWFQAQSFEDRQGNVVGGQFVEVPAPAEEPQNDSAPASVGAESKYFVIILKQP